MINTIKKLVSIEWLKFKNNSIFIAVMGIFTIGFPFLILLGKRIMRDAPPPLPSSNVLFEFPTVWDYQGYMGNWFVSILLGYLMIYMFTSEVSNKTMRQNILTGFTRKEYFLSKLTIAVLLSIYATTIYALSCIGIGLIATDVYDLELVFDNNFAIFRFFLMSMGYLTFSLLIANLVRRGILSILLYLAYIMAVEVIARLIIIFKFETRIPNFAPLNAIEDLMINPLFKFADPFGEQQLGFQFLLSRPEAIISSTIYLISFVALGWLVFKKKDL